MSRPAPGTAKHEGSLNHRFLDGHSLGGQQAGSEMTPFVGMEQFFLPAMVDTRLGGPSTIDQNGSALAGLDPSFLSEDVWW